MVFFRFFEGFVCLGTVYLVWEWARYIPLIRDVVAPLGVANYLDMSFMYGNSLPFVNAALVTICVTLGLMNLSRFAYLVAFLLVHLQFVARFCLGAIPHGQNMLGMTLLGLAVASALFSRPSDRRRFTLGFTYFFVGLGYTLAAVCKVIGTGFHWPNGLHLWMWIHEKGIDV
ncbi:MAG: hypothetical protein R3282_08200, partial [Rhodothermales bacterium]|nr:hypothetical protein [Rhodothermales bacterium]